MILLLVTLLLASQYTLGFATQYSLINCTWPCPRHTDVCVVTSKSANCQPFVSNSWVIASPIKSPFYTGASVTVSDAECISVPIPQLPKAQQNDTPPAGYSHIEWPIPSIKRPQDNYSGNCGHSFYCHKIESDSSPVCINRLKFGSACESSNQCAYGFCIDNICHPRNETTHDDSHPEAKLASENHSDRRTIKIVASVLGIVGAVLFTVAGIFIYKRRAKRKNIERDMNQSEENDNVEQQFAIDFLNEVNTSELAKPTQIPQQENIMQQSYKPPPYKP